VRTTPRLSEVVGVERHGRGELAAYLGPSDVKRGGPALSVHGLGKRFGDRVAFEDVSLEIGYGEVFGFLRPSGTGKTTTVRTLGTLIAGPPADLPHPAAGCRLRPARVGIERAPMRSTPLSSPASCSSHGRPWRRRSPARPGAARPAALHATSLIAFNVIPATLVLALGLAVLLLVLDGLGWRIVAAMFDRERLLTATR
jgi:hypothetical protein